MNILLDTHILLWHLTDNPRLRTEQSAIIENPENTLFFSIVSLWEIAIKSSLGKLEVVQPIDTLLPKEIQILDLKISHVTAIQPLPFHHRDPFDRILIAQAIVEKLHVMTDDSNFPLYPVSLL